MFLSIPSAVGLTVQMCIRDRFKGTIMEKIRYGRLDATDEEVIQAAQAAHAHHFIQTLPGGCLLYTSEAGHMVPVLFHQHGLTYPSYENRGGRGFRYGRGKMCIRDSPYIAYGNHRLRRTNRGDNILQGA